MSSINKVILIGNVGKNPEVKFTPSGMKIVSFSLATSESHKKDDKWEDVTAWHNIIMFNKTADYAAEKIKKGMCIYVEGKLKTDSWEGEDKVRRSKTSIIADKFQLLSKIEKTECAGDQPF